MKRLFLIVMLASVGLSAMRAQQQQVTSGNPIFRGWYADPEGAVLDGRYWVFPTYSAPYDEQLFFDAFSSTDLVHWQKHERVLEQKNIPWLRRALWAPSVIEHQGRYYLFFSGNDVHEGEIGGIGVAVADRPEGPYKDALGHPLINEIVNGAQPIDQFVFRDDDGQFYMYYGGWRHCNVCRLSSDLLSIVPWEDGQKFHEITPSESYVEGPFMLKRGGKYYFMWSEGGWTGPDYCVAYAIADSPFGPFRRIGKILQGDPQVAMGAGHHSVIQGPGPDEYYIIYHRRPLTETDGNSRETCIDRLVFRPDGTIEPVRMTLEGVPASPLSGSATTQQRPLTSYVNPLLGTATLWEPEDLGYVRTWKERTWGAEVFPGSSLPNAMVQCTPATMYHSGAGYQYEDPTILGFGHTAKGHWGGLHVPLLPATGRFSATDYASPYSHTNESAHPGYYQVYLQRYHVNAELTSTLRCAVHRYTFRPDDEKHLLADMTHSNNDVRDWSIQREGDHAFSGSQNGEGRIYFYAVTNYAIRDLQQRQDRRGVITDIAFADSRQQEPLVVKVGFSFVSIDNARLNLQSEVGEKEFDQIRAEADATWEHELQKLQVEGGTERQRGLFYSTLYRSLLWPSLLSDVNGEYRDARGQVVRADFSYYTDPSFWDDYRNKDILLGLLRPDVISDVIMSCIDRGEKQGGYFPTFFHGDHGSAVVAGNWLRGIHSFDLRRAYTLLYNNAFRPGRGGRPYLDEYLRQGWIAEKDTTDVPTWDEYKAAVTKTVEYAYDDYATALIARALGDRKSERELMRRSMNYKHLFDRQTGFWRGRIADGSWIQDFRPYYPYFAYQYREANAWNSLFFAPHDPKGVVALYPSKRAVELKLDSLFTEPWRGYEAHNMTGFIGNYCHGNQPAHSIPYVYYFVDRQPKAQAVLDSIMNRFYDMGREHLAYAGMDDAGEMSSWYVLNAIGLYTYSPADPEYIVSVPLFSSVRFTFVDGHVTTIRRQGTGRRITAIKADKRPVKGWFLSHDLLRRSSTITIQVSQ